MLMGFGAVVDDAPTLKCNYQLHSSTIITQLRPLVTKRGMKERTGPLVGNRFTRQKSVEGKTSIELDPDKRRN